jgi:hypothetical protein
MKLALVMPAAFVELSITLWWWGRVAGSQTSMDREIGQLRQDGGQSFAEVNRSTMQTDEGVSSCPLRAVTGRSAGCR